ncbi:Dihydrolipoyllysine-residue succinyltransferase component of 2-oxoglutarate dehydrogenase complex [Paenibacillus sp. CECT 9249]|uniref:dihydrolipoamide acetyltransferase family protein n=1 Tax=Paenibacillus sp. CECT 9249 TaxID=2845385 RepID=UPI001E4DAC78|nr:dihydrolipoamide acetyltransferase family protein [Paenibacillus sp. CECT 9249]CAH0118622.1 Dihydrolipoyllysine-residue succinyltransferase component of 2-oxoglutarate dehydrogenase complex [Paenibacillus sp. CECT 9249]
MSSNKGLVEVAMPQFAESLVSATIGKWLKKPGDTVEQYEPVCEVITDKVNAELPSTVTGVLKEIWVEEGQTVDVGTPICVIETAGGNHEGEAQTAIAPPAASAAPKGGDQSMRSRYSPAVQQLAAEHGIDLRQVPGTGLGGRITRKDVLSYIENGKPAPAPTHAGSAAGGFAGAPAASAGIDEMALAAKAPVRHSGLHLSETPKIPHIEVEGQNNFGGGRGEYFIDVTPIRNTIATRMRQSVAEIPHAWTMIEADVTNLVLLRNKYKDEFMRNEGVNLTYLAFFLKAVVNAIKDYPIMNSVWAVDKIIVKRDINLSLAVGTEDSVLTPVIKKADQMNIAGLARESYELAKKTREGKLSINDMQGGTFTVNNTGSFGSILSYPIINYPQAAIVTFESIVKKPVVINDMIAVRSMANICLSLDHRILDGVICGRFLQRLKDNLESYDLDTQLY